MNKKIVLVVVALLMVASFAFAEDKLIYEANFDKTDSKKNDWIPVVGDWEIASGMMINNDITNGNTNIYQELEQVGDATFIYEYKVTYDAKGSQWAPAAGIHIMASDGEGSNRGDSYLIFQDFQEMQIYRCEANSIPLATRAPGFPAVVGQTNVIRIEYNTVTGNIKVFLNGDQVIDWTDSDPLLDGLAISLRTNGTVASYDYVKVWVRK